MLESKIVEPILVVDIGNSNIVCAVFVDGEICARCRLQSAPPVGPEEYYRQFAHEMPEYPLSCFAQIVLGSVVPALTEVWQNLFRKYGKHDPYIINALSPLGLNYKSTTPVQIGADLVANALAAWKKYACSTIVVDLGTATTVQLITSEGLYVGVAIVPGMKTAAVQLLVQAAQLSSFELLPPQEILGNNTLAALRSGIVLGHALMIRGFVQEIEAHYPQYAPYKVVLTGGLSSVIAPLCSPEYILDGDLTLQGLYIALNCLVSSSL